MSKPRWIPKQVFEEEDVPHPPAKERQCSCDPKKRIPSGRFYNGQQECMRCNLLMRKRR